MNETYFTGVVLSACGALIIAVAAMFKSMMNDQVRKLAEIVIQVNKNTSRIDVHEERIETNKAKIDRHERLYENDFAERQAELIISKIRVMGYNGNGK